MSHSVYMHAVCMQHLAAAGGGAVVWDNPISSMKISEEDYIFLCVYLVKPQTSVMFKVLNLRPITVRLK